LTGDAPAGGGDAPLARGDGPLEAARATLISAALAYPGAYLDHPWGEDVAKVRGKIFVFFGVAGETLYVGTKLPESADFALMQPWAEPSGYNLGRAGWVSSVFRPGDEPPVEILRQWIDESYRAVAPRRLVGSLGGR
jgi:predicted DNA-binding protein (MmcQ/YjbR family)